MEILINLLVKGLFLGFFELAKLFYFFLCHVSML